MTEAQLEETLHSFVRNVILPDDVLKLIIKGLRYRGMKASRISSSKKQNLENEEIFGMKQKEPTDRLADVKQELAHCVDAPEEPVKKAVNTAVNTLEMTTKLEKRFKQVDSYEKAQLLKLLTDSLIVGKDNHITAKYREPFQTLAETKNQLNLAKIYRPKQMSHTVKVVL